MNAVKKYALGILAFSMLSATATVAAAYSYSGERFVNNVNYCYYGSSIPATWKDSGALYDARTAWNNAGSAFRVYYDASASSYLYRENRGNDGVPAFVVHTVHPNPNNASLHSAAKMSFNSYYTWSTSGESGKLDVANVATHEFGHWLCLNDLKASADTDKTMYWSTAHGETKKRTLHADDIAGIKAIY